MKEKTVVVVITPRIAKMLDLYIGEVERKSPVKVNLSRSKVARELIGFAFACLTDINIDMEMSRENKETGKRH